MQTDNPKEFWDRISQKENWRDFVLPRKTLQEFTTEGAKEAKSISKRIENGAFVIDYGCGVGRITIPMRKYVKEVIGLDISEKFIEICKKGPGEFHLIDDYKELGVATFVYSISVLQHNTVLHRRKIMSHIHDLLKEDGKCFINFPVQGEIYRETSFVHCFSRPEVIALAADAGFRNAQIEMGNLVGYGDRKPITFNEIFLTAQK